MQEPKHGRVLITGGTGTIGRALVQALLDAGNTVTVLVNDPRASVPSPAQMVRGDITDLASLRRALEPLHIDVCVHLAALTRTHDAKRYTQVNVLGTKHLVVVAKEKQISRFIFVSTRAVGAACGAYGMSKAEAEEVVRQSHVPWIILQPSEVYGGNQREAVRTLFELAKRYRIAPIIGNGECLVAPLYIDDFVQATQQSLTDARPYSTYVLAGPRSFTYNELIDAIEKQIGYSLFRVPIPPLATELIAYFAQLAGSTIMVRDQLERLMCNKSSDSSRARQDLGFNPIDFETGMQKLTTTAQTL